MKMISLVNHEELVCLVTMLRLHAYLRISGDFTCCMYVLNLRTVHSAGMISYSKTTGKVQAINLMWYC